MPKGYVIGQVDIQDPDMYATYVSQTPASVAEFGGRFLVRGGEMSSLEGNAPLPRVVVLEFPSVQQAQAWYNSPGYRELIKIRQAASIGHLFLVAGAD